jgi:hypothetical protein
MKYYDIILDWIWLEDTDSDVRFIGKSVKILDKVGARINALDALEALEKLGAVQISPQKSKQL